MTVNEIYEYLKSVAPLDLQEDWDNAGYLVGRLDNEITNVLIALDCTVDVINEAINKGCNLIISHHPIIFNKMSDVIFEDPIGKRIQLLLKNDISVISMHTNLDITLVNDVLIKALGVLTYSNYDSFMRVGYLENSIELSDYIAQIKESLGNTYVRYINCSRRVYKIACLGGAGSSWLEKAYNEGCDTFITGDVKHNDWIIAKQLGINLIDADHFNTEDLAMHVLKDMLSLQFNSKIFKMAENDRAVIEYA